uniref:Protein kinase domain-containing protein n=1 Tax=Oreochromis aureus TaxID=47969 RepID=A0AAZ1XVM7_OREAU
YETNYQSKETRYIKLKQSFLGEGGFGVVTRCRNTKNNQIVAIKVNKSDPDILCNRQNRKFSSWSSCNAWIQTGATLLNGTAISSMESVFA